MAFWRLSIYPSSYYVPNPVLLPTLGYVVEYTNFEANIVRSNCQTSVMKRVCPSFDSFNSLSRAHHPGALEISVNVEEASNYFHFKLSQDSAEIETLNEEVLLDNYPDCSKNPSGNKERQKSRKRTHGNKGKVPWNRGRKHTAETRALIKQRTIEALRDPQVRKKMSEHPHSHSDEIKLKIGSSLRRIWAKRLKWKRLREKFFLSWSKSIAEAARKGGIDQQELDWDSYDKIKEEVTLKQLQRAKDKEKAKELAKITAERAAQAKAEKIAKFAQKRKEREEKAKAREAKKKASRRSKKKARKLSFVQELTLKQRLTKIRKKKSINSQVITQGELSVSHSPAWKKLDVELMKKGKVQKEVSLADQIQAAKNKRTEPMDREALEESSTDHLFT